MKEVTMIYADLKYIECPYCGDHQDGWVGDPRGGPPETCANCGTDYKVSEHADIELR